MASPRVSVMGAAVALGSGMLPAVLPETETLVFRVLEPEPPADCWTWTEPAADCLPESGIWVARAPPEPWLLPWICAKAVEGPVEVARRVAMLHKAR